MQPGQDLFLTAPVTALPLARRIVDEAYKAGAGLVTPMLSDEEITLARFRFAPDASFDRAPGWLYEGVGQGFRRQYGAARHRRRRSDAARGRGPGQGRARQQGQFDRLPAGAREDRRLRHQLEHCRLSERLLGEAGLSRRSRDVAVGKLAEAIFSASRVDNDDPVAAWAAHNAALRRRTEWLNARKFHALHYSGPGTDLTIGLADGHEWEGGASTAKNGITCNPNIPTEEVFTTPHARRVDGHVVSTKPLSYQGTLIDGIAVRFEAGRIVEAKAARGEDVLKKVLDTDDGARRLGEVALVPHSSPISKSGLLFFNTLFDENAACHIALGQCYAKCFVDGDKLTPEEIAARGGNKSLIHIDWMIGSDKIDIDGLDADGARTPVFRKGEWA